jgi:hypothetical protein
MYETILVYNGEKIVLGRGDDLAAEYRWMRQQFNPGMTMYLRNAVTGKPVTQKERDDALLADNIRIAQMCAAR